MVFPRGTERSHPPPCLSPRVPAPRSHPLFLSSHGSSSFTYFPHHFFLSTSPAQHHQARCHRAGKIGRQSYRRTWLAAVTHGRPLPPRVGLDELERWDLAMPAAADQINSRLNILCYAQALARWPSWLAVVRRPFQATEPAELTPNRQPHKPPADEIPSP
jgi:hypothetical protein